MNILLIVQYNQAMKAKGLSNIIKESGKRPRYKTINEMHTELTRIKINKRVTFC